MTGDTTQIAVTVAPQPAGGAILALSHPDPEGPILASVWLTDEIIDYLMQALPKHYSVLRCPHGPTGPH